MSRVGYDIPVDFAGESFRLPPLVLSDYMAIEGDLRENQPAIRVNLDSLGLSDSEREAMEQAIYDCEIDSRYVALSDVIYCLNTRAGAALGAWMCLERKMPGAYSLDDISGRIKTLSIAEFGQFIDRRNRASGISLPRHHESSAPVFSSGSYSWERVYYLLVRPVEGGGLGIPPSDAVNLTLGEINLLFADKPGREISVAEAESLAGTVSKRAMRRARRDMENRRNHFTPGVKMVDESVRGEYGSATQSSSDGR